jgi:hypothetical protein
MQTRNVLLSGIANGAVGIAAGGASLPSAAAVRPGGPRIRTRTELSRIVEELLAQDSIATPDLGRRVNTRDS